MLHTKCLKCGEEFDCGDEVYECTECGEACEEIYGMKCTECGDWTDQGYDDPCPSCGGECEESD